MTLDNMLSAVCCSHPQEINIYLAALSALIHLMHLGQRRAERNMSLAVVHI